jgi:hypothetical protein
MSTTEKTIEVEPSAEGPKVRPKRQLTESQLAALKKGREKLAEKRKLSSQEHEIEPIPSDGIEQPKPTVENTAQVVYTEEDNGYAPLCRIM